MPKLWTMQSNFASGEVDPRLLGRVDLEVYYNSVQQAREVTPLVQGGLSRRGGSEFIDTTDLEAVRLIDFKFSNEEQYLLVFVEDRMYIYKDGDELQTNINGSGNDYLQTGLTADIASEMDWSQTADVIIGTHPDSGPFQIFRANDTTWTIVLITFSNIPQFDYDDSLSPTPTSEIQTLTFANQNTSDRYRLSLEGIITEDIVFSADQTSNADSIELALQNLINTPRAGISVAAVSITQYTVTFADGAAKDWDLLTGTGITTQNTAFTISAAQTQQGVARTEDVWSATRGWPVSNTFHEGRLWFGGAPGRPQTLWGSVVNDFFNFDVGTARDDEAVIATLDTDQVNVIQRIFSNRALQIFTTGQEFFISSSPITPENIAVVPQTNFGSKAVKPITIDGRTLYIQRTGKAIREFIQSSDVTNIYNSNSVTLLASHLVLSPTRMTATRGDDETDANYAYFVNNDGTLLVYNVLGAEGVSGFTLWSITNINVIDVGIINDELFAIVNDGSETHVVRFVADRVTDLGVKKATPANGIFTGLDHLEGSTVDIVGDGAFEGTAVVSSGQVTVDSDHTNTEVGLRFTPLIETMPLNIPLQNGPNFAEPKKINRVTVDFYESLGILVSNSLGYQTRIADKTMAVDVFDNPTPSSGREDIWLLGWDNVATVTITQEEPVPMTILSIAVEVGVQ